MKTVKQILAWIDRELDYQRKRFATLGHSDAKSMAKGMHEILFILKSYIEEPSAVQNILDDEIKDLP